MTLLAGLSCASASAASRPIVVSEDFYSAPLVGHLEIFRDESGKLGYVDVSSQAYDDKFAIVEGSIAYGYRAPAIWLRFDVLNTSRFHRNVVLEVGPGFLDYVEIFAPLNDGRGVGDRVRKIKLGDHLPLAQRGGIVSTTAGDVEVPSGLSRFYVRVATGGSMLVKAWLMTPTAAISQVSARSIMFGAFQGILMLTAFANILYWRGLRDRIFLTYGVTVLMQALVILNSSGYLAPDMFVGGVAGMDIFARFLVIGAILSGVVFVIDQTNTRQFFPKVYRIQLFLLLAIVLAVPGFFTSYARQAGTLVLLIGPINYSIGFLVNLVQSMRRVPGSAIATMGFLVFLVGLTINSGRIIGAIGDWGWTEYGIEVGTMVFIIYMQLALAQRTWRNEEEKRDAQNLALSIARHSQQTANRLIVERTHELAEAKGHAEEALRAEKEAQAEQIRFIDVISHQYRTPLSVVSNSISAIARTIDQADQPNLDRIDRVKRAVSRLVELIDVNLHRSRLEGASVQPNMVPVPLAALLEDIVQRARDICGDRPLDLSISKSLSAAKLDVDPGMINLALINVIENAHKFSPAALPIELTAKRLDDQVEIQVRDRGIGIPTEERHRLTQKYFRASNSANTTGMGLGLAMVASIIRQHKGSLAFAPAGGAGTVVTIILPLELADDQDIGASGESAADHARLPQLT